MNPKMLIWLGGLERKFKRNSSLNCSHSIHKSAAHACCGHLVLRMGLYNGLAICVEF